MKNPYPKYRNIDAEWIEKIPNYWSIKKVKYLFSTEKNQINVDEFKDHEVIHYSIPNIQEFGIGQLENGNDIDSSKLLLNGNELLVSRLNPRKSTICISVPNKKNMILGSGEFIVLVPKEINLRYCYYQFTMNEMTQRLDSLVESVTKSHQRIRPEKVFNTPFITPPKNDVERIVSFLDYKTKKIDDLIHKTEQKIVLLKEKLTSLINHFVTKGLDPNVEMKDSRIEGIGKIPVNWKKSNFRYWINILTDFTANGSFASLAENVNYLEDGYSRLVRLTDLRENLTNSGIYVDEHAHNFLKKSELKGGELLIANVGAYSGLTVLMPRVTDKHTLGPNMFLLKLSQNHKYFNFLLNFTACSESLKIMAVSSAQPKLNKDNIRELKVIVPPLEEQEKIVEYLINQTKKLDNIIENESNRIELLKEYRQALISEVVTGKIDVRNWDG